MFRCVRQLSSRPTAARHRASQTAMRAAACSTTEMRRKVAHADKNGFSLATPATVCPAFKTKDLAQLLQKSLPSTANVLMIDGTSVGTNSSASSILRFVITHDEEVSKFQRDPQHHRHPLLVLVKTSLEKDDADANEFVLSSALQQRDRFKDITAVILSAEESTAAMSVWRTLRKGQLELRKEEVLTDTATQATVIPAKKEQQRDDAITSKKAEAEVIGGNGRRGRKGKTATKSQAVKDSSTKTRITKERSSGAATEKEAADATDKPNKEATIPLSYTPPRGAVKEQFASVPPTRESLQKMIQTSLAEPFQPPKRVERTLFAGPVDGAQIADKINLPVDCTGEVYALYYQLTGAGACRTPLITIKHLIEEKCRKRAGKGSKESDTWTVKTMPVLLMLDASHLIQEDANLLCQEYQKALHSSLSPRADVTVVAVPKYLTEKNVLDALRSASTKGGDDASKNQRPGRKKKQQGEEEGHISPQLVESRRPYQETVQPTTPSLSEEVLRSVVSNALEEVALRHETSTDHIVSTLNKLVEYWSRERVIELMESLHGEREALIDATKEFENVQRQVRSTQSGVEEVRRDVKSIGAEIEKYRKNGGDSGDDLSLDKLTTVIKCIKSLETRLMNSLNTLPTKQQISLDMRGELEDVQRNIQQFVDQSLEKKLSVMQKEQKHNLEKVFHEYLSSKENTQHVSQNDFQELPQRIQTAMEKALRLFSQDSEERTKSMLETQRELAHSQLSTLCDRLCNTVEAGQERLEKNVEELLTKKLQGSGATNDDGATAPPMEHNTMR